MDEAILADVRARPCAPDVRRVTGCPPFGAEPASFNLLRSVRPVASENHPPMRNPENNQPPGYYALAAVTLAAAGRLSDLGSPSSRLLAARLFSISLVAIGIGFLARTEPFRRSRLFPFAFLGFMALPGASESLARCANDAAVFGWCCLILWAHERGVRVGWIILLVAVGPLLKPTAFPVVAFIVTRIWLRGRRRLAVACGLSSLLIFPLQALRGWNWGGTYELNRPALPLPESLPAIAIGFVRSVYTFFKTTFWLGGWSFFKAPGILVGCYAALGVALLALARPRMRREDWIAHGAGFAVAAAGVTVFAIANRRFFGVWAGVGGWYAWGWFPWLATACLELLTLKATTARVLLTATLLFVLSANLVYYHTAFALYR